MLRGMLAVMMVAAITGALGLFGTAPVAAQGTPSPSAIRSISPATVSPGGQVTVTITVANYGSSGSVTETLHQGFRYASSSLVDSERVDVDPQQVTFTLQGEASFTYTVTAPTAAVPYTFSGTLRDSGGNGHTVGGDSTLTVTAGAVRDPLIARFDANNNGKIEKNEVIAAINAYLFGGAMPITKADVIRLINLYLFSSTTAQPPGAPPGLTATPNGQTQIDLSWRVPASDGGAAITGYRVEVSTDRSSWNSLVSNTGSTATSYSHTGLTAGSARHYRVSAINSAGTGPASNVATATASGPSAVGPDLVVDIPTVSDINPNAGASFTLRATVHNQGNTPSDSTTLRYYRSVDPTISADDEQVGIDEVGGLAAASMPSESIDLTAPSTAGTYYYGACVDAVSGESDTANNCSDAATVTVTASPDLVVQTPSVSDSSPDAGAPFTLRATVRNQGGSRSSSTFLDYYRSSDQDITTSDVLVDTDPVDPLEALETTNKSISLAAPSSAGTYYYGACVQPLPNESNKDNNCSDAVRVTVVGAPDLAFGSFSASPNTLAAGAKDVILVLKATVQNQGNDQSDHTIIDYYRSMDEHISTSDTLFRSGGVDPIVAGGDSPHSTEIMPPSDAGTYYYGACVRPLPNESNKGNNCSVADTVTVTAQ